MNDILVLPLKKVLDGKGCLWELSLADKGWNELSLKNKIGKIIEVYTDGTVDVFWPSLNYTSYCVFTDEIKLAEE